MKTILFLCFRAEPCFSLFITLKIRYLNTARFLYKIVLFVLKCTKTHFVHKTTSPYKKVRFLYGYNNLIINIFLIIMHKIHKSTIIPPCF